MRVATIAAGNTRQQSGHGKSNLMTISINVIIIISMFG
jgi:hypothetical protein